MHRNAACAKVLGMETISADSVKTAWKHATGSGSACLALRQR